MKIENCRKLLSANLLRICALLEKVSVEQARWRPDPESWSILEVINHLLDEENLDFRVRLEITLHRPDEPWPGINPPLWVTERRYSERDTAESLKAFITARKSSLEWLDTLSSADWELSHAAPWGRISAGDLMASWVAHDLLHMRQLVELHWAYVQEEVKPYRTHYAGEW